MKLKKIKIFILLTLTIISISSIIFDSMAQYPGYYQGWVGTAPDGKWTCTCPAYWAPDCGCDYQG